MNADHFNPKTLTAAALAYAIAKSQVKGTNHSYVYGSFSGDDDVIPQLSEKPVTTSARTPPSKPRRVIKPVVVSTPSTVATNEDSEWEDVPTLSSSPPLRPQVATVRRSAVSRHRQSRQRMRSAVESADHQHLQHHHQVYRHDSKSNQSVASSRRQPTARSPASPRRTTMVTVPASPSSVKQLTLPPVTTSSPKNRSSASVSPRPVKPAENASKTSTSIPSTVTSPPVRFKVKSATSTLVLRFQCEPLFDSLSQNISNRLGHDKYKVRFQDAEGDWCILSDDHDVDDAIHATTLRKDTMVRLQIQEIANDSMLYKGLSSLGGYFGFNR